MQIEDLLNRYYDSFNETEKYICKYILTCKEEFIEQTIDEFAKNCCVSKTMVTRFSQKIGLQGYAQLKAMLCLEKEQKKLKKEISVEQVCNSYHKLLDNLQLMDWYKILEQIKISKRVIVYGSDFTPGRVGSEIKRIFLPVKRIFHIHGRDIKNSLKEIVTSDDFVILISLSGETKTIVEIAEFLRLKKIKLLSITGMSTNKLSQICDFNLYIPTLKMDIGNKTYCEIDTPYFILVEYMYLMYIKYLDDSGQNFKK